MVVGGMGGLRLFLWWAGGGGCGESLSRVGVVFWARVPKREGRGVLTSDITKHRL